MVRVLSLYYSIYTKTFFIRVMCGFFDSYELKLTRWEVVSEEECRFTGGCCTLYFRIENHKIAVPKIAGARFLNIQNI